MPIATDRRFDAVCSLDGRAVGVGSNVLVGASLVDYRKEWQSEARPTPSRISMARHPANRNSASDPHSFGYIQGNASYCWRLIGCQSDLFQQVILSLSRREGHHTGSQRL